MAVGVDYALFYVDPLAARSAAAACPPTRRSSARRRARRAGRCVVSGTTVIAAMAGMFFVGAKIFNSLAGATIAVVACAVAGSVTVLPAVLELLGTAHRPRAHPVPAAPADRDSTTRASGRPWSTACCAGRSLSCALSAAFLRRCSRCPALWLHVAKPSDEALASQSDARAADARASAPRSSRAPASRRSWWSPSRPARSAASCCAAVERAAATSPSRAGSRQPPVRATASGDGQRSPRSRCRSPAPATTTASRHAIAVLRDELVPQTLGRIPGARDRGHGRHRRGRRLHAPDEARHPVRDRLRARCSRSSCCWSRSARSSCR